MDEESVKEIQHGEDGALDHHGEALPQLSKVAARVNLAKINSARRVAKNPGDHPGVGWFYDFMMGFARRAFRGQFRSIEITGIENISEEAGMLTVAWHTNGLIDPMCIAVTQSKRLVFGGRHDLITRPLIGPIASTMGTQPVIRQAELARGGASSEDAGNINGKTMLTLAECIANGHASALFPEGTSHEDSKMKRLRTGPMRSVIAANSIAKERGLPEPHLLPVGLHYRTSWFYRTDAWIEYGLPIHLSEFIHSEEDRKKLLEGDWVEAEAESVNALRDCVQDRLTPMTPDAESWNEHRTWHLIGHLQSLANGTSLKSWREEVLAAREIRNRIRENDSILNDIIPSATKIASDLNDAGLDGRALSATGLQHPKMTERFAFLPAILLAIIAGPLTTISSGLMIFAAKVLGDKTDEGLDARTTYHVLAALLGPLLVWPIPALLVALFMMNALSLGIIATLAILIISPVAFHISNRIAMYAWDLHVQSRDARRLLRFSKTKQGINAGASVRDLLAALK